MVGEPLSVKSRINVLVKTVTDMSVMRSSDTVYLTAALTEEMSHAISFSLSPNKSSLTNHFCEAWQTAQSSLLWEAIKDCTTEIGVNITPGDMPVAFNFNKY